MTTTTILVWTSASSAVRHSCQHGWRRVDLDTSTLTPEQRELLADSVVSDEGARYGRRGPSATPQYDVAPPTAEGLVAHLQARIDARREAAIRQAAEDAAEDAALRVELQRIATLPVDALVDTEGRLRSIAAVAAGINTHYAAVRRRPDLLDALGSPVSAAQAVGRLDEARAHAALVVAERAQAKADREAREAAQKAAERAQLREIVGEVSPEILPILDAGMARPKDLQAAVLLWACRQMGVDPDALTDVTSSAEPEGLDPAEFHALERMRVLAQRLGDPTVEVSIEHDTSDDNEPEHEGSLAVVLADVAGHRIRIELPIEHVPLG